MTKSLRTKTMRRASADHTGDAIVHARDAAHGAKRLSTRPAEERTTRTGGIIAPGTSVPSIEAMRPPVGAMATPSKVCSTGADCAGMATAATAEQNKSEAMIERMGTRWSHAAAFPSRRRGKPAGPPKPGG